MDLGGAFYDIQLIYYGIPKSIPPRSMLSNNQPKNNSNGDQRDCEVSHCGDTRSRAGDPIDVLTGNFDYSYTDLSMQTIAGELSLQRSFASQAINTSIFPTDISPGWTHNQDIRLLFDNDKVWFKGHTLNQYRFDVVSEHIYQPYNGVQAELVYDAGQYILTTTSQSVYVFDGDGLLLSWTNERGYGFIYTYAGGLLDRITEPVSDRYLKFNYLDGVLQSVSDSASRQVAYGYDANGDLVGVIDVRGNTWGYTYNAAHQVVTVLAPGTPPETLLTIEYDDQGRAYEQHDGVGNQLTHIDFNEDGSSTSIDANGTPTIHTPDCRGVATRSKFPGTATLPPYYVDRAYDHNFNLTAVRASNDETVTSFRWSTDGADLLEMTDQAGNTTSFTYDSQHHLNYVDAPDINEYVDAWTSYVYAGPLVTSSSENTSLGVVTTQYTYTTAADAPQPVNLLKTVTDANNKVTQFAYDGIGQLIMITDADLNQTHFTYTATGQVETITDVLGRVQHLEYNPVGAVMKVIENYDPTPPPDDDYQYNLSTSYTYDLQGRLETVKDTNDLTTYTTVYDNAGRVYQVLDALNNPTTYLYNEDSTLDTITVSPSFKTSYDYDEMGRVTTIYDAYNEPVASYAYNVDSTLASETDAAGLVTNYVYDELHRVTSVTDSAGRSVLTGYDAFGDVTSVTDPLGRVTKYEYSDPGRLTAVVENYLANPPAGYDVNATNIRTEYGYYLLGNLHTVTDAKGNITTYTYDNLYQLDTVTDPLGHVTDYDFDELGNQESLTRSGEAATVFSYDLVNRLTEIDYPGGAAVDVSFMYNELSQLTDMVDSLGHTHWQYTPLGQPELITDPYDRSIAYEYDTLGNRTKLTYPGGPILNYQYDDNGQLEHVLNGTTPLVDYTYDDAGRLDTETYVNGVVSDYDYDISSQLISINHTMNGHNLALYEYEYDLNSNLEIAEETNRSPDVRYLPVVEKDSSGQDPIDDGYPPPVSTNYSTITIWQQLADFFSGLFEIKSASTRSNLSSIPPDRRITYTYDVLDRLKTAVYSTGENYSYGYDKVGNRTSQTINGTTTSYTYDIVNRLTSVNGISYTWNDNGSLSSSGLTGYTYDQAGRLSSMDSPLGDFSFSYDGLGNRYTQTVDGQTTAYTLDLVAGLTTVLREGTTNYLYGMGLIGQESGGEMTIALADRLGSVRQLITGDQDQTLLRSFDPFGNPLTSLGEGESGFGYTGEQTDGSGLVFLRARYYDPETGRFITADPFPGVLSLPATQNAYPYAINNPLSYTDPSGEILPFILAGVAGGLISGGINMAMQCIGSSSMESCIKCMDWGKVGTAVAAGAVAGFVGFGIGLIGGLFGAGILPTILTGIGASILSGQAYRGIDLMLTGNWDQASNVLWQHEDMLLDGVFGGLGSAVGWGIGKAIRTYINNSQIEKARELLSYIAKRSKILAGPGSGHQYGSKVHNIFGKYIQSCNPPDIYPEVSYLNGSVVRTGLEDSIRVDTILGSKISPLAIFELKTGTARLTNARINIIRLQLPKGYKNIPIFEIKP
jgi:RHS repeat-associated protein